MLGSLSRIEGIVEVNSWLSEECREFESVESLSGSWRSRSMISTIWWTTGVYHGVYYGIWVVWRPLLASYMWMSCQGHWCSGEQPSVLGCPSKGPRIVIVWVAYVVCFDGLLGWMSPPLVNYTSHMVVGRYIQSLPINCLIVCSVTFTFN